MYARAREERADAMFEKCIELADQPIKDVVEAAHRRIQIDVRKWAVGKLAPRKYGDHTSHDVRGGTTLNVQPAVLIKVGDGPATDVSVEAGGGVLLEGDGDIVRGSGGRR